MTVAERVRRHRERAQQGRIVVCAEFDEQQLLAVLQAGRWLDSTIDTSLPGDCYRFSTVNGNIEARKARCPLYPQKRTRLNTTVMSALCQKQTFGSFF